MFKGEENEGDHAAVTQILVVEHTVLDEKYLGLPTPRGRIKGDRFQTLKERLSKRLQDYSQKHMSLAAKEVLIKVVAQSIPTYIMNVFKLPLGLCDDLSSIIRQFWWDVENGGRKMAWIAWKDMISKKCCGVWGSKIFSCLTKLCWQGKHGSSFSSRRIFVPHCLKLNIFLVGT
jgi:hypothetical protein